MRDAGAGDGIDTRELGSTSVRVTRFALGSAPLGGLYEPVGDAAARAGPASRR